MPIFGVKATIIWARVKGKSGPDILRTPVPGGWLVTIPDTTASPSFVPDPGHEWDGSSEKLE